MISIDELSDFIEYCISHCKMMAHYLNYTFISEEDKKYMKRSLNDFKNLAFQYTAFMISQIS